MTKRMIYFYPFMFLSFRCWESDQPSISCSTVSASDFCGRSNRGYHRTIKADCIRPGCPLSLEDAQRIVAKFVDDYKERRLHSALGYITPRDKLLGREKEIFADRDRKLEAARERRRQKRRNTPTPEVCYTGKA